MDLTANRRIYRIRCSLDIPAGSIYLLDGDNHPLVCYIAMTELSKRVSQISIESPFPARVAVVRLPRACWGPILTQLLVRAIQTSIPLESKDGKRQIILNCEGNTAYKVINHWLVLTRPLTLLVVPRTKGHRRLHSLNCCWDS
jgi:hypothetical protein